MKRCSECDFIYEDEQNLCDMDGHELVSDPTLSKVSSTADAGRSKTRTRRLVLAVAVAVLLGALLSIGFSGLTQEEEPQTTTARPTRVNLPPKPLPDLKPAATPNERPATPAASPSESPSESPRLEKTRAIPVTGSPLAKSTAVHSMAPRREIVRSEPVKANHKKDSGIGGFLKKTGKILKRPFKF